MTKSFIKYLGCLSLCAIASLSSTSCDNDDNEFVIGDKGCYLLFQHCPADSVRTAANTYAEGEINADCLDMIVLVVNKLHKHNWNDLYQPYYLAANKGIEQQLSTFLDPNGEYNGNVPIHFDYTTKVCKSITIKMYDKDKNFVMDLTDKARFHYKDNSYLGDEKFHSVIINSQGNVVGTMPLDLTISQYLAYKPMVFTRAHFIFPDIKKDIVNTGNYLEIEIELENGNTLIANTIEIIPPRGEYI